ncbi:uncharacterized protein TOT_010000542 [Theileria orientalis strain Shintoku]|uniref:SUN domain-containing protein n=1 Tax=Theileria orientalis strain Shintoku TaxID=869250 RepID=J4D5N8_THEOR|nr:uncharacterized protein TOT_010000542 [Theileria orientalis strain Shintoku]BAM39080.1 uncharacterized protein TOT_010000542 [Theileria orientalis strain Shintoku]|eukprot:XP_009689381.1 uncharacterized protein TOT_010000542 [Theileria orientalis strain Shintoku]
MAEISKGIPLKKDCKIIGYRKQKYKFEYLLRAVFFVLLVFVFVRKILLFDPPELKVKSQSSRESANIIRGKPYNENLYSLSYDFATEESGAKIIAHSKSLENISNILRYDNNIYMLAPCQTTDWFILSFQESILIQQISFLSYEFYASSYKNLRISVSNVYPTSKFVTLAEIETEPLTNEIFDLAFLCDSDKNDCWCKYVKVELLDYHKEEDNYYCAITKMKVYGITAVEYLESEIGEDKSMYQSEEGPGASAAGVQGASGSCGSTSYSSKNMGAGGDSAGVCGSERVKVMRMFDKAKLDASPTFLYDIKNTIMSSFYKFLMSMALRRDEYNKKLLHRLIKIGKSKKYCGTNLLFQFNCNRFITYLLLEKYSAYYSTILEYVRLPRKHTWFERVVFDFIKSKKSLIYSIINDVGIKEVPVLVCIDTFGVVSTYKCYFYFNLKSFSTLLFTEYTKGVKFNKIGGHEDETWVEVGNGSVGNECEGEDTMCSTSTDDYDGDREVAAINGVKEDEQMDRLDELGVISDRNDNDSNNKNEEDYIEVIDSKEVLSQTTKGDTVATKSNVEVEEQINTEDKLDDIQEELGEKEDKLEKLKEESKRQTLGEGEEQGSSIDKDSKKASEDKKETELTSDSQGSQVRQNSGNQNQKQGEHETHENNSTNAKQGTNGEKSDHVNLDQKHKNSSNSKKGRSSCSKLNKSSKVYKRVKGGDRFYFYYADGRSLVKNVIKKYKSLTQDVKLVERCDYRIADEYISSITVVGKLMYINLSPDSTSSYPVNLDRNSEKVEEKLVKMNRNMYRIDFLNNLTKYFDERCYANEMQSGLPKGVHTHLHPGLHSDLDSVLHNDELNGGLRPDLHVGFHGGLNTRLRKEIDSDLHKKDQKVHKHVLLKLSERIKSLEYLTNKLSNKIYEVERLLNIAINQQIYRDNESKPKNNMTSEFHEALRKLNINRYKVITRRKFNGQKMFGGRKKYYQRIRSYSEYEVGYLYMDSEEAMNSGNMCRLSLCVPNDSKCRRTRLLSNLSKYHATLNRRKLIGCIIRYNCKCLKHTQQMYSAPGEEEWLYTNDASLLNEYLALWRRVACALRQSVARYINAYSVFAMLILTQIFWILKFNEHNKQIKKLMLLTRSEAERRCYRALGGCDGLKYMRLKAGPRGQTRVLQLVTCYSMVESTKPEGMTPECDEGTAPWNAIATSSRELACLN